MSLSERTFSVVARQPVHAHYQAPKRPARALLFPESIEYMGSVMIGVNLGTIVQPHHLRLAVKSSFMLANMSALCQLYVKSGSALCQFYLSS